MEYNSQLELYLSLLPVLDVKKRLSLITKYPNIKNEDIWKYLSSTKWRNSTNLTISEMVNDIITVDIDHIYKYTEGEKL